MRVERLFLETCDFGDPDAIPEGAFSRLEDGLMKRGTLAADTIDWKQMRADVKAVLDACLHLQAFRCLAFVAVQSRSDADLITAIKSLGRAFMPEVWPGLHPTGPKANRRRQQWAIEILAAIHDALEHNFTAQRALDPALVTEAQLLAKAAKSSGHDVAALEDLLASLHTAQKRERSAKPVTVHEQPTLLTRDLDARGRAELRRDLRALAERITRFEPDAALAYEMRRYAAWLEFRIIPQLNEAGNLDQQPMPANIVDEFRAYAERPSDTALARLEERLYNSPDWFEGHQLAARMAQNLGYSQVDAAITQAARDRLAALPELLTLHWANGTPVVGEPLMPWLRPSQVESTTKARPEAGVDSPENHVAQAEIEREPDLESKIAILEDVLPQRSLGRARALAKLNLAMELAKSGLRNHAILLLGEIGEVLSDPTLASWDSELASEVGKKLKELAQT
ncbi:type VI secretion system ImpA/VasJ family protein [Roseinatronobacter monicus]|uniref:Type VI secretion system ImpA/VasJ family protein n=2 Tax=Roseinatronobacter monicus TaxID=393481 RepID=A0A543K4G3_9RHOB|nr:type VI secretion system ImpA/VasJ family protein [Roseinatronobacter monicus]